MAKPQVKVEYTPPLKKKIWKWLKGLISYPHRIAKRYAAYNYSVGEMMYETKDGTLDSIRKRNSLLVNLFIYLPMMIGLLGSAISIYSHKIDFVKYYYFVVSPLKHSGFFSMIGSYIGRFIDVFTKIPLTSTDLQLFVFGYGASIVFSYVLSKHTAFREEAKITHIFSSLGYIDSEGNPWKVTWTPDAIMITAFNCDPVALCANNRFWSSVNFPPSRPKVFRNNMNKFVVTRRYELPNELIFKVDEGSIK